MRGSYWEAICAGSGQVCGHRHVGSRQGEACARRLNHRLRVRSVGQAWYCLEVWRSVPLGNRTKSAVAVMSGLQETG